MGVPPRLTGRVVTTTAAWWGEPLRPLTSEAPTSPKHQQALRPALPPAATEPVHRERQRSTWWPWAQRHPRVEREAGVAACEHQAQQVISNHRFGRIITVVQQRHGGCLFVGAAGLPADPVHRASPGGHDHPGPRTVRDPGGVPRAQCLDHGVLQSVLGERDVAGQADQCGQDPGEIVTGQGTEPVSGGASHS